MNYKYLTLPPRDAKNMAVPTSFVKKSCKQREIDEENCLEFKNQLNECMKIEREKLLNKNLLGNS